MPVVLKREDESKWLEHHPIQDFAFPYDVNLVAKEIKFTFWGTNITSIIDFNNINNNFVNDESEQYNNRTR